MNEPAVIVPVTLDALLLDDAVARRDAFHWWQFNYNALRTFLSPEPEAFQSLTTGMGTGVYLHWSLPAALRRGEQDRVTGEITYPLVPNRWLIVRMAGGSQRQAKAWVVESDCPFSDLVTWADSSQSSLYGVDDPKLIEMWQKSPDRLRARVDLDPGSAAPQSLAIGVAFPLETWSERDPHGSFLTAMGPSNPVFSTYVPHNLGVFSFYDDLRGVSACDLSYFAVGWYSDPTKDPVAAWPSNTTDDKPFEALLDDLGWMLAAGASGQPVRGLYQGMALSIAWSPHATAAASPDPLQSIRDAGQLDVAVGNTTIDAFCALLASQLAAKGYNPQAIGLLRALQYDLLNTLEEPNGDALLAHQIRDAWFRSKDGGYRWALVPKTSGGSPTVDLTAQEEQFLGQLNTDQAALDDAIGDLLDLQWRLNALWHKRQLLPYESFPDPPGGAPTDQEMDAQLDPQARDSLAARVTAQSATVQGLMKKVPQPIPGPRVEPQDALAAGIAAFATGHGVSGDLVLKAVPQDRFWQPNDPVVVIGGVDPPAESIPNQTITVRTDTQLVKSVDVTGGTPLATATATAVLGTLTGIGTVADGVADLVDELVLLDPASADALAAASGQAAALVGAAVAAHAPPAAPAALPAIGLAPWSQPWEPMFLEWEVGWSQIDPSGWWFDGGAYHHDSSTTPAVDRHPVSGISLLGPQAQFVLESRLDKFVSQFQPHGLLADLRHEIASVSQWRYLSQELTGFSELLALRDTRAFRRPTPADTVGRGAAEVAVPLLAGYADATAGILPAVAQGQVGSIAYLPDDTPIPFHGVRQGQLHFDRLALYDKFGRVLLVIADVTGAGVYAAKSFPVKRDPALIPSASVDPSIDSVVELAPRLLQPARLGFAFVDATRDGAIVGTDPTANPICGWVLPNHLDGSVLVYAPDGTSLGEYRLVVGEGGTRSGHWHPPAHSDVTTLDQVKPIAPRVWKFLSAANLGTEAGFQAFLDVIDTTLWTTDPLRARNDAGMAVLMGRPLALVRGRIRIELQSPALRDTSWPSTLAPPEPEFVSQSFSVRLGDLATRDDGLVGYFKEGTFETFNSIAAPESDEAQGYVQPIGPPGAKTGANYIELTPSPGSFADVTMLVDPRAGVHAITGLFPTKRVDIPAGLVEQALAQLEATFRIEPLLTFTEPTPTQRGQQPANPNAVRIPYPAERNGTWSWWQHQGEQQWIAYDLVDATPNALLKGIPIQALEGVLQLVSDARKG